MFDLIAIPLGWLMYLIYQVVHSYGFSIIFFTLLIKMLTLPSMYKQQVNAARQGLIAPKLNKLRKSFATNPQRLQEETQKLFREEGINQTAGCLGSLLTMFLLLGVYRVVMQPLTHILRYSAADLETAKNLIIDWATNHNLLNDIQTSINGRPELMILSYAKSNPEIFSSMGEGFVNNVQSFHNSFLGFDLAGIPSLHPETWSFTAIMLIILPILSALAQLVMTVVSQVHMKKVNPATPSMGAMNLILYLSPIMTVWIGMSVPAGLTFYWLISSLLQLVMMVGLYKYLSGERLNKINEKEKAKVIAKGPTWMQRMMEQSMEMQNQQNGGRNEANRSRYSDGDDGMSRKERAEYERKLIEARRRAVALKYGEDYPEKDDSDID